MDYWKRGTSLTRQQGCEPSNDLVVQGLKEKSNMFVDKKLMVGLKICV